MTQSAAVRERLAHPVIDGDGHTVESLPILLEFMQEVGGTKVVEKYLASLPAGQLYYDGSLDRVGGPAGWHGLSRQMQHDMRVTRPAFWSFPTGNALDRATVMVPNLFRKRLDDLGIDFAIVYTSSFRFLRTPDEDVRRAGCRALNVMHAEMFASHADRMTVPALIPMHTPEEAIDELEYAVKKLGMKAVTLGTCIRRPIVAASDATPYATWIDTIAHASAYDYDPVWRKCVELKVAPTAHSGGIGWGTRTSPENFVYNHIGHFAAAGEAFCKALVIGGVVQRFPDLRFAFLEGGGGWACSLYNDLIEHWKTRNLTSMRAHLDPANLDQVALRELFAEYGEKWFEVRSGHRAPSTPPEDSDRLDDWEALSIEGPEQFAAFFSKFFFGCEAEDRMTAVAFNTKLYHFGTKLQAFFSSDVGHFDVLDITKVLAEAYELVEDGLLSQDDFRDFTFKNVVKLYASQNSLFFKGTVVEDAVEAILPTLNPA